ncbi:MAG TPA: hypothetical protein EYP19_06010 [Desulfobacterales bacterium]|nr:hypothetical protein [Desulfobacterales bacterium]
MLQESFRENRLEAVRDTTTTRYVYDAAGNLLAEADGYKRLFANVSDAGNRSRRVRGRLFGVIRLFFCLVFWLGRFLLFFLLLFLLPFASFGFFALFVLFLPFLWLRRFRLVCLVHGHLFCLALLGLDYAQAGFGLADLGTELPDPPVLGDGLGLRPFFLQQCQTRVQSALAVLLLVLPCCPFLR